MESMQYFLEIYGSVPRAGPGSFESTKQAYGLMSKIPDAPYILDIGCGPGAQTVDLLKLSAGSVLEEARNEIGIFRKYSSYFSYGFLVMRLPA